MTELKIVSQQIVGPMEASFVAQGNQRRIDTAEPVIGMLEGMRAKVNELDNAIEREASLLKDAWNKVKQGGQHKYETEFSNRTYWLTMLGLMAVETPLNAASLEFARLDIYESWVVAGGFALLNFFGAKSVGRTMRQAKLDTADWRHWAVAIAVTVAILFALTQFAALRQLDPKLGSSAGAFLALQVCFFMIVAAVTFFHLDSDPTREQMHRRIARGQKVLSKTWNERVSLAKVYNTTRAKIALKLVSIEEDTNDRVAQYRVGNMLHRAKEGTPSFMTRALGNVWVPIPVPASIDEEPLKIGELVGRPAADTDLPRDEAYQPSAGMAA